MKLGAGSHIKREKLVGFAVVLLLHLAGLYGLWSYRIILPPAEVLTVFATIINPPPAAKRAEPAAPKPPLRDGRSTPPSDHRRAAA